MTPPGVVIFDIGRVVLDWDPRLLFRKLLPDEAAVTHFLTHICPPEWNLEQDRGRRWDLAVRLQSGLFPEHAHLIAAWHHRWHETVPGTIPGTCEIVEALQARGHRIVALTNFSAEKWEECLSRFPILQRFDHAIVSGQIGLIKPDPRIYAYMLDLLSVPAEACFFTDDSPMNIDAARAMGLRTHLFRDPDGLRESLRDQGLSL